MGNIAVYMGNIFVTWLHDGDDTLLINPISDRSKASVFTYTNTGGGVLQFKWDDPSDTVSSRYLSFIRSSIEYLQYGYTYACSGATSVWHLVALPSLMGDTMFKIPIFCLMIKPTKSRQLLSIPPTPLRLLLYQFAFMLPQISCGEPLL
ncbi:hypothetical protein GYMLUDRAFT_912111 [Collybiopsis luxurians FD-317 M1]|nr:hypothetical protein GYMLUDRAFT_912111 [Collybiopsis luxurians FD-317 M1]